MKTKLQDGDYLDFTAPYNITVDEPVLIGQMFGIAFVSALKGESITLDTVGVFELAKEVELAFKLGDPAYFDPVKKTISNVLGGFGSHPVGYITRDEQENATKCFVRLTPQCLTSSAPVGAPLSTLEETEVPSTN